MSLFQATLSLVSSLIGAGMLGFPFVMYQQGLIVGIITTAVIAYLNYISCELYFACKDMTPLKMQ